MYAQIYAESDNNSSTGKTMRVWSQTELIAFSVNEDEQLLKVTATCRDRETSSWRGGDSNPVTRAFRLDLNKEEVEKLVATALNDQLLKKIGIRNLAKIDRVGKLELEINALKKRLTGEANKRKKLQKIINEAKVALSGA